jgi:transcription initiation factor TFIIIB Brf1 subunit/transcription initiation factor TFIIB
MKEMVETCENCGIPVTGTCKNCGLVHDDINFVQDSYKMFTNDEKIRPTQYISYGNSVETVRNLGSYIGYGHTSNDSDFAGVPISQKNLKLFNRLKGSYSKFARIRHVETEYRTMYILSNAIRLLNLSQEIRRDSAYYYKKIKDENKVCNNVSLIAYCLYLSTRNHSLPVSIESICKTFTLLGHRVNSRLIRRDALLYKHDFKKNVLRPEDYIQSIIDTVIHYSKLESRMMFKSLNIDLESYRTMLYNKSMLMLSKMSIIKRGSHNPRFFACAIIYSVDKVLAEENSTKKILTLTLLHNATEIPSYTIRDIYQFLKNFKF